MHINVSSITTTIILILMCTLHFSLVHSHTILGVLYGFIPLISGAKVLHHNLYCYRIRLELGLNFKVHKVFETMSQATNTKHKLILKW